MVKDFFKALAMILFIILLIPFAIVKFIYIGLQYPGNFIASKIEEITETW